MTITKSKTNGNIVVDGKEITVYVKPKNVQASDVIEDSEHNFITEHQKYTFVNKPDENSTLLGYGIQNAYTTIQTDILIDSLRYQLVEVISQVYEQVKSLKTKVKDLQTKVTQLEEKVNTFDEKISVLEDKVFTLENKTSALEENVTKIQEDIIKLDERLKKLENPEQ